MMKRVGVTRLAAAPGDDQPPLIIATGPQIQQQSSVPSVGVHAQQTASGLHENPSPQQTTIIVSTQQVINYSKGVTGGTGALQYAGTQYGGATQVKPPTQPGLHQVQHPRHKGVVGNQSPSTQLQVAVAQLVPGNATVGPPGAMGGSVGASFQRLKVEDALSYLDKVKYNFNNQPQVYNDFLDIMKEFKSQSIDTPGVIARVSNLFKGHPDLIVGFNTFLPPGYKIEVQANDQGYAYQVSVSMPSPNSCSLQHQQVHNNMAHAVLGGTTAGLIVGTPQTVQPSSQQHHSHHLVQILPGSGGTGTIVNLSANAGGVGGALAMTGSVIPPPVMPTNTLHHISQAHQQLEAPAPPPSNSSNQPVEFNHAIEYVNKIKNRFNRQPEKYKRFLEILHAYQRGQKEIKEPQVKQQTEKEVYEQVKKLFENQEDLLEEFGQFLPETAAGGGIDSATIKASAALDAVRIPDQRSRPLHISSQRNVDSIIMEQEIPVYHTTGARAPSPVYSITSPPSQISIQQPIITGLRQERDISQYNNLQSSQINTQHLSSQVSSHHTKHSSLSHHVSSGLSSTIHPLKRSPSFSSSNQIGSGGPPPAKKHRLLATRDVSFAEAAKYGALSDFSFFDRVRRALKSQEVYDNFLRCLLLFTNEIISKSELLAVTAPFFSRHQELYRWLQDFLGLTGCGAGGSPPTGITPSSPPPVSVSTHSTLGNGPHHREINPLHPPHSFSLLSASGYSSIYSSGGERYTGENNTLGPVGAQLRQDRPQGDAAMEIDLTTCRRLGTSYCALPRGSSDSPFRRCSGRTPLCRDVLNETWVSFPTWAEDSTFVTSRKTQFEEYIYRCEDERFELDVVIETNASTILALEGVHKQISRMSPEDAARFRLNDCLGGNSPTIHQRALKRIYGEKANDIIAGLKKNPLVAVPVVLRRLKTKEEEWREAQKGFNKQWRELNEKYYLKSLDYQGVNFKQNDLKALRSKSLFNEIETIYDERREQMQSTVGGSCGRAAISNTPTGAHLMAQCGPGGAGLLTDAADLLIHHVRRQTAIQKQEKQRVKQLLRHFLPDLFQHPRQALSDDERDDDDKEVDVAMDSLGSDNEDTKTGLDGADESKSRNVKQEKDLSSESDTNTPTMEKVSSKGNVRLSKDDKSTNKENKENHKCSIGSRNNSGDSVELKDTPLTSKSTESNNIKTSSRRREGSNDSAAKIKSEPMETPVVADSLNSLPSHFDMKSDNVNEIKDKGVQPVVFFGSGHWYVFLRLHAVLCQRLAAMRALAQKLAREDAGDQRLRRPATAVALRLKPDNSLPVTKYYVQLLEMIRSVLDGNTEASTYEDNLRDMFGVNAYIAFTLDKVVSYAVRQLQQCVQERSATKCVELHLLEKNRASGSSTPNGSASYQRRVQKLLRDEHAFKICIFGGEECRVTFELLESGAGGISTNSNGGSGSDANLGQSTRCGSPTTAPSRPARLAEWIRYRERYANPAIMDNLPESIYKDGVLCGRKALYLQRNIRQFKRLHPKMVLKIMQREESESVSTTPSESTPAAVAAPSQPSRKISNSSDDGDDDESNTTLPNKCKRKLDQNNEKEKLANSDPVKDFVNCINDDKTEGQFNDEPNGKFAYVQRKEHYVCWKRALQRAWKCHKSVSQQQEGRWKAWLDSWHRRNVTQAQSRTATEWMMRGTRILPSGGPDEPPYTVYSRYRLASPPPHAPDR